MSWPEDFAALENQGDDVPRGLKQVRGREFEKVLHRMLSEARMHPRESYRPPGEEIDGSFIHRDRIYLYEAKWTGVTQAASALYQFRGKVDGKLAGTVGVFFSMSGYSPNTVDALVAGKTLNLILFDGEDVRMLARREIGFRRALDFKVREAVERGNPYAALSGATERLGLRNPSRTSVVVEGQFDAQILQMVVDRFEPERRPDLVPAGGPINIPRALAPLVEHGHQPRSVVVVIDGDDDPDEMTDLVRRRLVAYDDSFDQVRVIVMSPSLEQALRLEAGPETGYPRATVRGSRARLRDAVWKTNFKALSRDNQVADLLGALGISPELVESAPTIGTFVPPG